MKTPLLRRFFCPLFRGLRPNEQTDISLERSPLDRVSLDELHNRYPGGKSRRAEQYDRSG